MHSYVIRLKFNTSDHNIDCEALLAGLAVSVSIGMKDLHVFMDSPRLVAQTEGNHTPTTKQEKKYKKEITDATASFHRFRITHLPKILSSKAEVLTGLATIKLEFLNQEYMWVSKQDHRWKRQVAARREKQRAMYQVQNQTTIGKLEGAIEGTCNHIYLIALCNPSEVAIFKVLAHLRGPLYFYI
ncbi:reverse transcriptase domain-containing protein [Tanacetum coccineum]